MITVDELKFQDQQMEEFMQQRNENWRNSLWAPSLAVILGLFAVVTLVAWACN